MKRKKIIFMYEYIIGKVIFILYKKYIIIETYNIGYKIFIVNNEKYIIGKIVKIFVFNIIKENVNILYGFNTLLEKKFFIKLIKVSGVGPKNALMIISKISFSLILSIKNENIDYLIKIPGIGKKIANKIIFELKDKISEYYFDENNILENNNYNNKKIDLNIIKKFLIKLGYKSNEINFVIYEFEKKKYKKNTINEYIKESLKIIKNYNLRK